tara:strand:+ start:2235 stop:3869 length:1635 start_codon:yes stop_codon:yes gene_type:complete
MDSTEVINEINLRKRAEKISRDIFSILIDKFRFIKDQFANILNIIVNSPNYKYYISILLTLVFILLVILTNLINVPDKYVQIISLLLGGIIISIFYFFVYRNEQETNEGLAVKGDNGIFSVLYNKENKKLVKKKDIIGKDGKPIKNDKNEKIQKNVFDSNNFKNTIIQPIKNLIKFFSYMLLSIILIVLSIVFIYNLYINYQYLYNFTKIFLGFAIVIIILAIIAKSFSVVVKNCEDSENSIIRFLCIIKNIIFFIPCLLVIFTDEINKDIKSTPSSVYLLFILLMVFVSSFIGLPMLFQFISSINKHNLLYEPHDLDKRKVIGKYQDFNEEQNTLKYKLFPPGTKYTLLDDNKEQDFNIKAVSGYLGDKKFKYKYTYSISFYLYLNPQPKNTSLAYNKETELFNYANKPVILYDGNKRKLLIKSKTQTSEGSQTDTIYETKKIKYQKWNFITINYDNNTIDVFIDGKLVGSKKNVPPFFDDDKITIGEDNGIQGSIKEISYYNTPRPPSNIEFMYDLTVKPGEKEVNSIHDMLNHKIQKNLPF